MTPRAPILLVEDDPALAELVLVALRDDALPVVHVATGAEAIAEVEAATPRLVLLDLDLPDMRGLQVLDRVRALDPARTVPVVVLSSSEDEDDVARAAALGANSYVVKPTRFDEFRDTVQCTVDYWTRLHRAPDAGGAA